MEKEGEEADRQARSEREIRRHKSFCWVLDSCTEIDLQVFELC